MSHVLANSFCQKFTRSNVPRIVPGVYGWSQSQTWINYCMDTLLYFVYFYKTGDVVDLFRPSKPILGAFCKLISMTYKPIETYIWKTNLYLFENSLYNLKTNFVFISFQIFLY